MTTDQANPPKVVNIPHERFELKTAGRRHQCWSWREKCKAPGDGWDEKPGCTRMIDTGEKYLSATVYPGHDSGYADNWIDRDGKPIKGRPVTSPVCLPCARRWKGMDTAVLILLGEKPADG